ncbi:MAG TPA: ubiquinol-cytochrome c reductase iron-sulfur subunit [Bacteroidales bacterium]|nr:ubiquinol-cytochrome c reductase iron-sulfur subunit [Bacteroidales bacterium]
MNRRDSLQKLLMGGTVLFLVPSVIQSCSKDNLSPSPGNNNNNQNTTITVDLSQPENASLNTTGGYKVIRDILVFNTGSAYLALSSVCTHQGCTVAYNSSANKIQCPCHGSEFSTSGSVINGPASQPLASYAVSKSGNVLTITT